MENHPEFVKLFCKWITNNLDRLTPEPKFFITYLKDEKRISLAFTIILLDFAQLTREWNKDTKHPPFPDTINNIEGTKLIISYLRLYYSQPAEVNPPQSPP